MKPALRLHALPGLGDNIHSRGVLPALMAHHEVFLKTDWPVVFRDMPGLRFGHQDAPADARQMLAGYHPNDVPRAGSVLGAMALACGVAASDFRIEIPVEWERKAGRFMARAGWRGEKPLLILRPLIEVAVSDRENAYAKLARNPDPDAYAALFRSIRDRFFVVRVANCQPNEEWLTGPALEWDADAAHGELDFETMAALFELAEIVFCPPGFAVVLAQAVGTKSICVFGGFEDARSFAAGAEYTPWLPIEPLTPCPCWSSDCKGDKTIDLLAALERVEEFV